MPLHGDALGLFLGAVALGAVHGIEPGHGWPVAASYALDQSNKWLYGLAASVLIGVGHLVSSIAMVAVFFYAKSYFRLTQVNEPVVVAPGVEIGGPVSIVAGVLLLLMGVREYRHGRSRGHGGDGHDHEGHTHDRDGALSKFDDGHAHVDEDHSHAGGHAHGGGGLLGRVTARLPFRGGHSHDRDDFEDATDRGLLGIAWFAFLLGFAHEEEFEIIALCYGSAHCLELMTAYAVTVVVGIVGLTVLLLAGYQHFEETVEQYTGYLPVFSAVVLCAMGLGFVTGLF
ncbi:hypothetical protein [Haloarcula sp. JP-L23]|uniref:hypothetical protein n=1 Tax=Haloarcula sp. JP-L23 TaxID=2716717 RepID=UPI00140EFE9E|nr:hypothetical protein G9465_12035 [Haloarcula sp. JP-L23]